MTTTIETARPVISRASELARAAHAEDSRDCLGYYDEDTTVMLLLDAAGLPVLAVADVIDDCGSREEIAKAAALFSEIGAKLAAHAEGVTTAGAK